MGGVQPPKRPRDLRGEAARPPRERRRRRGPDQRQGGVVNGRVIRFDDPSPRDPNPRDPSPPYAVISMGTAPLDPSPSASLSLAVLLSHSKYLR